jgi:hypothetical protein
MAFFSSKTYIAPRALRAIASRVDSASRCSASLHRFALLSELTALRVAQRVDAHSELLTSLRVAQRVYGFASLRHCVLFV